MERENQTMNPNEIIMELRLAKCYPHDIELFDWAADMIRDMQALLAASQERERVAVEDLYTACTRSPCNSGICVKKDCAGNKIPCEFEWRGLEAGKGEAE